MTQTSFPLARGGVSLVLTTRDGHLPVVTYWGPALDGADDPAATLTPPFVSDQTEELVECSLLPEESRGWLGTPGLAGHRAGRHSTHAFVVDEVDADATSATFRAVADGLALTLTVALTEEGVVELAAELTNTGADAYTLDALTPALRVPPHARELLDLTGRHLRERSPQRHPFSVGSLRRDNRRGRTSLQSTTLMIAGEEGFGFRTGRVWGVHVAWSGNHTHLAERSHGGEQILAGGELFGPGELVLAPGETYATPMVLASFGVGLDALSARYHGWLRRVSGPRRPRPITLNTWEAVYFAHDHDALVELAEAAARVGVERFVLDDGWFGSRRDDTTGLGDWAVSDAVWPGGLEPLAEAVRGLGMEFGLWVEPEMVNLDSDLARAHPDWILRPDAERLPLRVRNQHVLNLTRPEVVDHLAERLVELVRRIGIAYLKWDHNRDLIEACGVAGERLVHDQTLAYYRLVEHLKRECPGLEIESCASGGGRVDLGVLTRTDRIWASDCNDALERQDIQRWTGLLLPPEVVGAHVGPPRAHTTGRTQELSFRAGTALFGHFGIEWDLRTASQTELERLAAWVGRAKEVRDLLATGATVRTEDRDGTRVHGVVGPDRALFAVVQLATSPTYPTAPVTLPGLDPDARWRVRLDELTPQPGLPWASGTPVLSGRALAESGLAAPTLHPEHLAIIHLERSES
ncbi:alpha-galactosidase [Propioniciclava soli]|uniref:alpha-galactosidase n=1 Tax=Propioniciclava soli TaxID=2775081 RepID=UPI001E2C508C